MIFENTLAASSIRFNSPRSHHLSPNPFYKVLHLLGRFVHTMRASSITLLARQQRFSAASRNSVCYSLVSTTSVALKAPASRRTPLNNTLPNRFISSRTFSACTSNSSSIPSGSQIRAEAKDLRSNPDASHLNRTSFLPNDRSFSSDTEKTRFAGSGAPQRHDLDEVNRRRTELPNPPVSRDFRDKD